MQEDDLIIRNKIREGSKNKQTNKPSGDLEKKNLLFYNARFLFLII